MKSTRMLLAVFAAAVVLATSTRVSATPEWRTEDNKWCLRNGERHLCLPGGFAPTQIGVTKVQFRDGNVDSLPLIFVDYVQSGADEEYLDLSTSTVYELESSELIEDIVLSKYKIDPSKKTLTNFVLFSISKEDVFEIWISGPRRSAVMDFAMALVEQWRISDQN